MGRIERAHMRTRALLLITTLALASANVSALPPPIPPQKPSGFSVTALSGTQISVSWVGVPEWFYPVERCEGAGCAAFVQILANGGDSGFVDSGLTPATTYTYRVRARNNVGQYSGYTTSLSATTLDSIAPSAPSISAGLASGTAATVTWSAATDNIGVSGYQLERCQGAGCATFAQIVTTAGTSYTDSGLAIASGYSYRVRAYDAAGNYSGYSNTASIVTPDTLAPSAPSSAAANATSSSQINVSWAAASDNVAVTGYLIERCTGIGCSSFAQIGTSGALGYADTGLAGATSYTYRVRAVDAAGNASGYSNTTSATTLEPPDTQPPSAPTGLNPSANTSTQVTVTWSPSTDNKGVTGYDVERCQGAGCSSFAAIATVSGISYLDSGLNPSTTYVYRVRARDAANNQSAYSTPAQVTMPAAPDTDAPSVPTGLLVTASSSDEIRLSWTGSTDNTGVTQYLLERCQGANCSAFSQIAATTGTTYNDTGLTANTTYRYRVRARDAADNRSGYSTPLSTTTAPAGPVCN